MTATTLSSRTQAQAQKQAQAQAQAQLQPPPARPGRRQRGVSLVETMMALAIVGVTLGAGLPGLGDFAERQRLRAMASLLETDLKHARSEAVARNQVLRLSFGTGSGQGCYVLHTGISAQQCQCGAETGASVCTGSAEALRSVTLPPGPGLRVQANVGAMAFEPHRGTVTPAGTVQVLGQDGARVHLVVNIMGRVRGCSPNGAAGLMAC